MPIFQWDERVEAVESAIHALLPNTPKSVRYEIATMAKRTMVDRIAHDLRQLHSGEHSTAAFTREALLEQVEQIVRGEN